MGSEDDCYEFRYWLKGAHSAPARDPAARRRSCLAPRFDGGPPRTSSVRPGGVPRLEPVVAGVGRLHGFTHLPKPLHRPRVVSTPEQTDAHLDQPASPGQVDL